MLRYRSGNAYHFWSTFFISRYQSIRLGLQKAFAEYICSGGNQGTDSTWSRLHQPWEKRCRNRAGTLMATPQHPLLSTCRCLLYKGQHTISSSDLYPRQSLNSAAWLLTSVSRLHQIRTLRTLLKKATYFTLPCLSPGRKQQYRNTASKAIPVTFQAWPSHPCFLWIRLQKPQCQAGSLQAFLGAFQLVSGLAELGNQ